MRASYRLPALLACAFALRLAAYGATGGIVHADEVFQYAEQAHRLVFGHGLIPWEWRLGIRNGLFPGLLAGVMELARLLGDGPRLQNAALAAAMAAASLPSLACAYHWGRRAAGQAGAFASFALVAAWPDMLLAGTHTLIDAAGLDALIPALFLLDPARPRPSLAGTATLGLALALRPQLAPVAALALLPWLPRLGVRGFAALAAATTPALLAAGALDWAMLGAPFASYARYIAINRAGAAEYYGVSPWYEYLLVLPFSAGWLILLLVPLAWAGSARLRYPAACAGMILLSFSLVAHKEFRFVLPAFPLLLTLCGAGAARALASLRTRLEIPARAWHAPALALLLASLSLANAPFVPAAKLWQRSTGMAAAEAAISDDPTACTAAIAPPELWYLTGGYTHLRPGLVFAGYASEHANNIDYVLAAPEAALARDGYTRQTCWPNMQPGEALPTICLWHHAIAHSGGHCPAVAELVLPDPPFLAGKSRP